MSCMMHPSCILSQIHAPLIFCVVYSLYSVAQIVTTLCHCLSVWNLFYCFICLNRQNYCNKISALNLVTCVPNINSYWSERKQVIVFQALRDVAEGKELCISYKVEMESQVDWKSVLQENFGFECQCAACSLLGEELDASHHQRMSLQSLYDKIVECVSRPATGVHKVKLSYWELVISLTLLL